MRGYGVYGGVAMSVPNVRQYYQWSGKISGHPFGKTSQGTRSSWYDKWLTDYSRQLMPLSNMACFSSAVMIRYAAK
jgi:hypothetical protein